MSVYNDYMVKLSVYITELTDHYAKLMTQGADCCCIKNKLSLLNMYFDMIPRAATSGCITDAQLLAITNHINDITGYSNWGTLSSLTQITPPTIVPPIGTVTVTTFAWNTTIGTTPIAIVFDSALGTSGTSWAITYTATNSDGDSVFVKSITSRTANGFIVDAYEDNVHFEGSATLIT